jgi:hypothetical protein
MSESRTPAGTDRPLDGTRDEDDAYASLLRVVDEHTGPADGDDGVDMPPAAKIGVVAGRFVATRHDPPEKWDISEFDSRKQAARSNGDLVQHRDADGNIRLALTDPDSLADLARRGVEADAETWLRDWVADLAGQDNPNRDLIGALNAAISEVSE